MQQQPALTTPPNATRRLKNPRLRLAIPQALDSARPHGGLAVGPWHQAGLCLSQASRSRRRQVCRPYTLAGEGEIRAVAMTRRKITTCLTPVLQSKCIAVFLLIYHEQSHACTRIMKLLPAAKIFLRACGEAKTATNSYESH